VRRAQNAEGSAIVPRASSRTSGASRVYRKFAGGRLRRAKKAWQNKGGAEGKGMRGWQRRSQTGACVETVGKGP
jgi:hypothetical protein